MEKEDQRDNKRAKISRISIVDQVCASIKQDIVDGIWKEGEKIPSETELADTFGVNRLSVRMALQKLNTLGVIETRVGEGSYIRLFSLRPFLSEIAVFYDDDEKYREVQQLRNLLEGECINIAIISSTTEEKNHLLEALNRYNIAADAYNSDIGNSHNLEQMVDADFSFHYQVIKMGRNGLYQDIYFMVQQLIRRHITQMISARSRRRKQAGLPPEFPADSHAQIYNSILHGDIEAARRAREEILGIIPVRGLDIFD